MKKTFNSLLICLSLIIVRTVFAESSFIDVKKVEYGQGKYEGILVSPKDSKNKKYPGILMIHNWMGVSPETQKQAERFASLGYVVLTADVYGKGVRPKGPAEAGPLATQYKQNRSLFRERLSVALDFLKLQSSVDPQKIAALGYCFGGTGAIELARSGAPIRAAVSFHGSLDSPHPDDGKNIKGEILAHHGADDPFVKPADVEAFENELKTHHVKYQLIKYPGAVHSFTDVGAGTDNSKGAAYNKSADEKSFATTKDFLRKIL